MMTARSALSISFPSVVFRISVRRLLLIVYRLILLILRADSSAGPSNGARDKASATEIDLPGRYSSVKSYCCVRSINYSSFLGAFDNGFANMETRGLLSVKALTCLPYVN